MKKIMLVFGTRPEAIKMAPLVKAIQKDSRFTCITVVSGQHREMLDQVLNIFKITPDYDLNIMSKSQGLNEITTKVINKVDEVIKLESPDIVLVHGDTTTTLGAAIAAFYNKVMIGHVEAGLRTWNKYSPFPEEMNRQLTDVLSDLYFAPTEYSKNNLLKENHSVDNVFVTGNTVIDAMKFTVPKDVQKRKQILVTMHRRENLGQPMANVMEAISKISKEFPEFEIIYPLHKNPKVREIANKILGRQNNVKLIEPLDVIDFHRLESESYLILTDSGGVQEEAPSFGVPVLVLRNTTERPEGVEAGILKLIGTEDKIVYDNIKEMLTNPNAYKEMSSVANPYGDGFASEKILDIIDNKLKNNFND